MIKILIFITSLFFSLSVFADDCECSGEITMDVRTHDQYCDGRLQMKWNDAANTWLCKDIAVEKPKLENCQWTDDLPRQLLASSDNFCSGNVMTKTCSGYVVCDGRFSDGTVVKIERLSTCSEKNCAEGKAMACTREGGYSSSTPAGAPDSIRRSSVKDAVRAQGQ